MSRFIAEHPNPWGWNPYPYCGLPVQFLYLPLVHYATAMVHWLSGIPVEHAYRWLVAAMLCMAPVTVFAMVRVFTRSAYWALAASFACVFFSPSYGLFRAIAHDRGFTQIPWRLQVLVKYGEGPHNTGLMLIPLALIAIWFAATRRRYPFVFAAAVLIAAVVLTNWIAALALAILAPLMMLSAAGTPHARGFSPRHAIAAGALAYLLSCFWLTPSFITTTAFNWPADAHNYQLQKTQTLLLAAVFLAALAGRLLTWLLRWPFYATFVTLAAIVFGIIVTVFYAQGINILPEAHRYAIEFELFLILALIEWIRLAVRSGDGVKQACAAIAAIFLLSAGVPQAHNYVRDGWAKWRPIPKEQTAEYQVAGWIARQRPQGRVLATGGLRFRMSLWFDLQQVGGSFESGLRNRKPLDVMYRIRTVADGPGSIDAMKGLGIEYVAVHTAESTEHYRDYKNPLMFEGLLERVFTTGSDHVYRVPFAGFAYLAPGRTPMEARWSGTSQIDIKGPIPYGSRVGVLVSWDPGWRAFQDGTRIPLRADPMGLILLDTRPAKTASIRLVFGPTAEQIVYGSISASAWALALAWLARGYLGSRLRQRYQLATEQ